MIETYASQTAAADAAAAALERGLAEGLRIRGRASLAATGGRSPAPVYQRLRTAPIDWARVVVTLTDERWTDPMGEHSNERLVREHLLTGAAGRAHLVPLWSQAAGPDAAAQAAEPLLAALRPFDAVLLGMGEDGHIASLFPGSPVLAAGLDPNGARLALGVEEPHGAPPLARITLTLAALSAARSVVILISGSEKRAVVEAALAGEELPVRALLCQEAGPVRVLWAP
ncbi:MAG: 6-phosphogluconolactonase [Phenylobacterium sp.]